MVSVKYKLLHKHFSLIIKHLHCHSGFSGSSCGRKLLLQNKNTKTFHFIVRFLLSLSNEPANVRCIKTHQNCCCSHQLLL